ncbi:MAG: ferritin-like domain-containing protein [Gaiellaceae bacterium]
MAGIPGYPRVDDPDSRDRFLRRALAAGGTVLVGGALAAALPRLASSAQSPAQDAEIFNFALLLEQVQAAFYDEAASQAALPAELLDFAKVAAGHEREHVGYLTEALGMAAQEAPATDFGDATTDADAFAAAAASLEDLAVGAYNGQAANLTEAGLKAAATVVSVDARHAAWVRAIAGRPPASQAVDAPLSRAEAEQQLDELGFIQEA